MPQGDMESCWNSRPGEEEKGVMKDGGERKVWLCLVEMRAAWDKQLVGR